MRDAILPEWWDDSLFDDPTSRLMAEMSIARYLRVDLGEISRQTLASSCTQLANVRLKRATKSANLTEVTGAVTAALTAAQSVAYLMRGHLPFTGVRAALEIRNQILSTSNPAYPDLSALLSYCWNHGIGVLHLDRLPRTTASKAIAGLATFIDGRPIIVLCSQRDSPAWLLFHLSHEIGHVMLGHVTTDGVPLVDIRLDDANDEHHEQDADRYAFQVLTGRSELSLSSTRGLKAPALARAAMDFGQKHKIHPGTVALIYGYCAHRMPVAQAALSAMNMGSGAKDMIAQEFRRHVDLSDLPELTQRMLAATTRVLGAGLSEVVSER